MQPGYMVEAPADLSNMSVMSPMVDVNKTFACPNAAACPGLILHNRFVPMKDVGSFAARGQLGHVYGIRDPFLPNTFQSRGV